MNLAALIISIVALILAVIVAGFGILLQFLTYRATSDQTSRVSESLTDFRGELNGLLKSLEGQTSTMAGFLKEQFNTMLDAFVRRPEAAAQASRDASQSAAESLDVIAKLEDLEARVAEAKDLESLKDDLEDIRRRVGAIGGLASSAAKSADQARLGYSMFSYWIRDFDEAGKFRPFNADVVELVRAAKRGIDDGDILSSSNLEEWYQAPLRVVELREHVLERALQDGVVRYYEDGSQRLDLTDRGRRVLELVGDMRPEDIAN